MYCLKCGKKIPNGSKFCQYCGTSQITTDTMDENKEATLHEKKKLSGKTVIIVVIVAAVLVITALIATFFIYPNNTIILSEKIARFEMATTDDISNEISDSKENHSENSYTIDVNQAEKEGIQNANIIVRIRHELADCLNNGDVNGYISALKGYENNKDVYDYAYTQLRDACNQFDYYAAKIALTIKEEYPSTELASRINDYLIGNQDLLYKSLLTGKWKCIGKTDSSFHDSAIEIKIANDNLTGTVYSLSDDLAGSTFYTYSVGDVILRNFKFSDDGACSCDFVEKCHSRTHSYNCELVFNIENNTFTISNPQWPNLSFQRVDK